MMISTTNSKFKVLAADMEMVKRGMDRLVVVENFQLDRLAAVTVQIYE